MWKSEELRFYTLLAVGSSALVTLSLVLQMDQGFTAKTVTDAAFQVVTVMTTTGYSTVDFDLWPTFARMILVLLMFTGACAGSTAGGIKSVRMVLLLKNIRREARRVLHPPILPVTAGECGALTLQPMVTTMSTGGRSVSRLLCWGCSISIP